MGVPNDPRPSSSTPSEGKKCLVCGDDAKCNHFGALVCKSCAAFFRRAATAQSKFNCRRKGACSVLKSGSKICSSCRYRRCLDVGMKETSVMSVLQLQAATQSSPTPEATLIPPCITPCIQPSLRFAVAANRCQNLRNFGSPMQYDNRPACKETVVKAFWSELRVLKDYFCGLGDDFYSLLRDDATPTVLSQSFIMEWSLFETALSTLVNEGQRKRHMHFVDHSLVELDEPGLSKFYGSDRQISDLPDVVRFCLERYGRFIEFVKRLEKATLDDVEQTGLMQLVFAQCLLHMFESLETRAKFVNKTLLELHKHYKSMYADYVGRLDALLTLLGPFMELRHAFEEMGVFIELHSRPKTGNVVILSTRFQIVHKYFEPLEPEKGFYI